MKDSNRKENIRKFPDFDGCVIYYNFRVAYCNSDCPCYEKSDAIRRAFCEITRALLSCYPNAYGRNCEKKRSEGKRQRT